MVRVPSISHEKGQQLHRRPSRGRGLKLSPEHGKELSEGKGKEYTLCSKNCMCEGPEAEEHGTVKDVKEIQCSKVPRLRRTPNVYVMVLVTG